MCLNLKKKKNGKITIAAFPLATSSRKILQLEYLNKDPILFMVFMKLAVRPWAKR